MFAKMQESKDAGDNNTTYRTEASYLEIYNERVKDLLGAANAANGGDGGHRLKVREHPKEGPYVQNLSKHLVMDYSEIRTLMERGNYKLTIEKFENVLCRKIKTFKSSLCAKIFEKQIVTLGFTYNFN
jgi:hypothetical protein